MQIVHVQTTIQTVFGTLDDEGNVVNKQPVSVDVPTLAAEHFTEAANKLREARTQMQAQAKA